MASRVKLKAGSRAKVTAEWVKCGRALVTIVRLRADGFYVVKWSKQSLADKCGTLFDINDLEAV